MMANSSEIFLLVFGLLMSAFYSGSEAAIMSFSPDRIRQIIEDGGKKAQAFNFLLHKPSEILITILIGNNLVNIMVASLTTSITHRYFNDNVLSISVGLSTVVILFFGEILPKTFARGKAEKIATFSLYFIKLNYYMFSPIVIGFMSFIRLIMGKNVKWTSKLVTMDDIEFMVNRAEEDRSIDAKQIDLLNSIIEFPTIKVREIMVPRNRVDGIKVHSNFETVAQFVKDNGHSRYPVYQESLDDVSGFLHVKDIFGLSLDEKANFELKNYLKAPFFVYEHMKIQTVFDHMNRNKLHMAMVKDENGVVVGVITLEDIIEEILGEIHDEHDSEEDMRPLASELESENALIVPFDASLRELSGEYNIDFPLDEEYSTIAGFLLNLLGESFPKQGQLIIWDGFSFELIKVENKTIKEVKITDTTGAHPLVARSESGEHEL